jgi:alkyldihydroxyacetonephosphate synthase
MGPAASTRIDLVRALSKIVGARVSHSPADRLSYARDQWPRTILALRDGEAAPYPPDAIVWPESAAEIAEIVRFAAARKIPVTPYGAGSGVCGGAAAVRGGILIDVKRMNRLLSVDPDQLEATFETGILGEHLEHTLGRHGLTLGHFPSSIMCSTLGGWLAARSAGQMSSKYGKIEDMALGMEVVLGTGEICAIGREPRGAPGPDWAQLFIGCEGTLGIITRATMRVRRAPEARIMRGFELAGVEAGCEAIRRLLQAGLRPAVVRLYDQLDTFLHRSPSGATKHDDAQGLTEIEKRVQATRGWLLRTALNHAPAVNSALQAIAPRFGGQCLLIVGFEGDAQLTEVEAKLGWQELNRTGARDLGPEPGERWLSHRYRISFQQSKVFDNGAFVDTMEVASTWDRLLELYHGVREAIGRHALVMAHFSHAYSDGCSVYFTFMSSGRDRGDCERRYDTIWRSGMAAALAAGGVLSHHHGIGMSKQKYIPEELGLGLELYRSLKRVLDPQGVLNPGKMGLG